MMKQSKNEFVVSPSSESSRSAYRVKIKIADTITTVKKSIRAERNVRTQSANKTKLPCNVGPAAVLAGKCPKLASPSYAL